MGFFRANILTLLAAAVLAGAPLPAQAAAGADASNSGYAGGNACRTCHPNVALQFFRNPHNKSNVAKGAAPENMGCEGCHGPGKKHVDAKGGKQTILAFSELPSGQILDACLRCHAKDPARANIRKSNHTQANVVCTACHSIHQAESNRNLLAKRQAEVCYECHSDVRAQFAQPFKHRVNEGFMNCSDCHNPHGTNGPSWKMGRRPHLADTGLQNEQACLKCHTDKRGPFLYEHAAVRVDGCETCHAPHGSMNSRLLKRPVVFTLCLECHNGVGGFGRQGDGVQPQSASHNMTDPRYRNCSTCHVRIHGSNSDRTFLR